MKILVVGHLCLDVIHPFEGPEIVSYGGIYYAVGALAALLGPADSVLPVFGLNVNDYPQLIEHLERFPNVDVSGIYTFDAPSNRVTLDYHGPSARTERSLNIAAPIPFERIRKHLGVDGILINMISGFDISLDTLDQIRMAVRDDRVPIHFDYHSLTLGVDRDNIRFRRPLAEWRRWGFMLDTLQLNEEEIAGLSGDAMAEEQTAGHLLTLNVKGLLVTRGPRGATLYTNAHKRLVRQDFPGYEIGADGEPTGCGDVFGAAFHVHFLRTSDLAASAAFANRTAAAKALLRGTDQLMALPEQRLPGGRRDL